MSNTQSQQCGQCRDCKYWRPTARTKEQLKDYPRDKNPADWWLDAVCVGLHRGINIVVWESAVDVIETDANFGCRLFEAQEA